ncbi:MAG TPA: cytochrome c biogenesis heme-transporting ATPase CcmA [Burkholderiaceae bacterium]
MTALAAAPASAAHAAPLPTLSLADVACRRGNRLLFKGVDLELRAGAATWLRGRNGRGKTSLLRLAAGLAVPESGRVLWGGAPLRGADGFTRTLVFIGHTNALKDDLTVIEALQFLARLHGRPDDSATLGDALQRLGMATRSDAFVRTLSQGQRRRAALARLALERAASLWILDEPYDALDADGVQAVNELLHAHLARGGAVLLTSHQAPGTAAPEMAVFDLDPYA